MAICQLARSGVPALRARPIGSKIPSACPVRPALGRRAAVVVRASDDAVLTRGMLGEFTGSTLFQLIGSASAAAGAGAAIAGNSLGLIPLIYAFASVSGAHLNPAVSFMLLVKGDIDVKKFISYAVSQIAGCVLGALLCTVLIPGVTVGMGADGPGAWAPAAKLGAAAIFGWECIMTAFLCLTVNQAAVEQPGAGPAAPIAIGLVVMAAALSCGTLSGSLINPARALGPALVFQNLSAGVIALYLTAQFTGAALAAALAKALNGGGAVAKLKAAL